MYRYTMCNNACVHVCLHTHALGPGEAEIGDLSGHQLSTLEHPGQQGRQRNLVVSHWSLSKLLEHSHVSPT